MFLRKIIATTVLLSISQLIWAQTFSVKGKINDNGSKDPLIGVTIILTPAGDATQKKGAATDIDGNFSVNGIAPGSYNMLVTYLGYTDYKRAIKIADADLNLGTIGLAASAKNLKDVVVEGKMIRTQQLGDTSQFNAGAFKTNPDANAEDLVNKMPGVSSADGTLKVNGEEVKKVLVDGKPFFGDDPNMAMKNLPAEIIDKIQVFDKTSDQAQFTGFDDGNTEKTINIITKRGKNQGQFGKVYAGYGTDDRYIAGGNLNYFNGDRRISVIGLSNNINQQNFNMQDLLGVTGSSGNSRGGSSARPSMPGRGGGSAGNFMVGQQGGITTTNAIGLNYSDNWGKKIKVSGSYFFNNTKNENNSSLERTYFTPTDSGLVYHENNTSETKNNNHRFNLRLEYNIDSSNSIILTPSVNFQNNQKTTTTYGVNTINSDVPQSSTNNNRTASNSGYTFSNDLLYRHKFGKPGRTISFNLGTSVNHKTGDTKQYTLNEYYQGLTDTNLINQQSHLLNDGYTLSGSLTYTEPITKTSQLMFRYAPSYNSSKSNKETFNYDNVSDTYNQFDTLLSNKYNNTYLTQRGGISYRITQQKLNFMAGVDVQHATLNGEQFFPNSFNLEKTFFNVLPQAMLNYKFSKTQNLRANYRTSTNAPSISQLQNVIDNSNSLQLTTGNPNLKQSYSHNLMARYSSNNVNKATTFFAMLSGTYTQDYIGNSTLIATKDTVIGNGVVLNRGNQLSLPVNLDGYYNMRGFITYGMPLGFMKSNLNLNTGVTYARTPTLINNIKNLSNNYGLNGGAVLSSNISENVDFTIAYMGNYSQVKNTIQSQSDNSYYNQTATAKINWITFKRLVWNTDISYTSYTGLNQSFNQNYVLWNAYVAYKFLKDRSLEVKLSAFDILKQNNSIARNITDTYIEDSRTQVLQQYFMVTLTYSLRKFASAFSQGNNKTESDDRPMMPPPGMPRPGGFGGPGGPNGPGGLGGPGF